jgi:hypothetical protein
MFGSGLSRTELLVGECEFTLAGNAGALARIEREARTIAQETSQSARIYPRQSQDCGYTKNVLIPWTTATFIGLTNFRASRSMRARAPAFPA